MQEVHRQRKRDRGLVVEVELSPDPSAEGEASFAGLMATFLQGARRERDSLGKRSEAVMVRKAVRAYDNDAAVVVSSHTMPVRLPPQSATDRARIWSQLHVHAWQM